MSEMNMASIKGLLGLVNGTSGRRLVNGSKGTGNGRNINYIGNGHERSFTVIYGVMAPITYTYDEKNRMFKVN
ncbi:MAG: hypothetical protein AT709_08150 [Caldivirga sp. MG_3]|nr:MAG: hypothetical protein AT709_08150 [Caldivirga sp. MG_3]